MRGEVRFEQAVYGSFPFWDRGYAILAHSPGCRGEWLKGFEEACRAFGEIPAGVDDLAGTMFSRRLADRGPWLIVGVSSPGTDDRGRPHALAFHGLFVEENEFRAVGFDPFALLDALRADWSPETTLPRGRLAVVDRGAAKPSDRARAVASVLASGKKAAVASGEPILALACEAWGPLPDRLRKRLSVATWTFANGREFDFVAAPSLAGLGVEGSHVDPFAEPDAPAARPRRVPIRLWVAAAAALVLAAYAASWIGSGPKIDRSAPVAPIPAEPRATPSRPIDPTPGPRPQDYPDALSQDDRDLATSKLRGLAIRVLGRSPDELDDFGSRPTIWMLHLHGRRYDGPLLTDAELEAIAREPGPGRSRALAWDRQVRRFADDRPLPAALAGGPLRWQIDTLAWSFHVPIDPTLTAPEAVDAIADALTLDEPIRPNPLAKAYPALAEYAKFLARLPAR